MNGNSSCFRRKRDKTTEKKILKILRSDDGMTLAAVVTAFAVLMVILLFMTTAVLSAQKIYMGANSSRQLFQKAEEQFFTEPDGGEVIAKEILFLPENEGEGFGIENGEIYRFRYAQEDGEAAVFWGFRRRVDPESAFLHTE